MASTPNKGRPSPSISPSASPSAPPSLSSSPTPATKKAYSRYNPENIDRFVNAAGIGALDIIEDYLKKRLVHSDSRLSLEGGMKDGMKDGMKGGMKGEYTCLMMAALNNQVEVVKFLLGYRFPPVNVNLTAMDSLGGTALIIAAHRGHDKIVDLLYNHIGIDLEVKSNHRKLTALEWALKQNHRECVRILDGSKRREEDEKREREEEERRETEAKIAAEEAERERVRREEREAIIAAGGEDVAKLRRFLLDGCSIPSSYIDIYLQILYIDLKLTTLSRIFKRKSEGALDRLLGQAGVEREHIDAISKHLDE